MNLTIPCLYFLVPALSFSLCTAVRAELPAGTAETLPASSPYGEATVYRNIAYVPAGTPHQTFDLYLPKEKGTRLLPFIVWMHGGAWEMSNKEWDNVKYLVKNGYAIATVDYRLAPADRFPAQIQDCNAALNFIVAHAETYGLDAKQFVIGGASAGGHLSLLLGLARNEKNFGADPAIRPLATLDFFGLSDLSVAVNDQRAAHAGEERITHADRVITQLLGTSPEQDPAKALAASPVSYIRADAAPVLILHGTKDSLVLVVQSERLHSRLDDAGVHNQLILVEGAPHDGPDFETPTRQAEVLAFLRKVVP